MPRWRGAERGSDSHKDDNRLRHRAAIHTQSIGTRRGFHLPGNHLQIMIHVNPFHDQGIALRFHFTCGAGDQPPAAYFGPPRLPGCLSINLPAQQPNDPAPPGAAVHAGPGSTTCAPLAQVPTRGLRLQAGSPCRSRPASLHPGPEHPPAGAGPPFLRPLCPDIARDQSPPRA